MTGRSDRRPRPASTRAAAERRARLLVAAWALAGCTGQDVAAGDTGAAGSTDTGDTGGIDDSGDTGAGGPVDADGDGHDAVATGGDDCDDGDPAVSPSAEEVAWNGLDDDCDGRADADGTYAGTLELLASAVYEGRTYSYVVPCEGGLVRTLGEVSLELVCTPDLGEDEADRLLGAELTVAPSESPLELDGATWSGNVEFTSSNGWDTRGQGSLTWADGNAVSVGLSLDAASLEASAAGTWAWIGQR